MRAKTKTFICILFNLFYGVKMPIPVLKPDKTVVSGFGIPVARREGESPDSYLKRIMVRAKEAVNDPDKFNQHMRENFIIPNQDIIRDYNAQFGSTFEEAMKWAVKEDAINDPEGSFVKGILNAYNKEMNKRALRKAGIKRVN